MENKKVKLVTDIKELKETINKSKKGETIVFLERNIKDTKDYMDFQKYIYDIVTIQRLADYKVIGGLVIQK